MPVTDVDDTAAGAVSLGGFIDENALTAEMIRRGNPNRPQNHPFKAYWQSVLASTDVPGHSKEAKQIASDVCAAVARLPFVPSDDEMVQLDNGDKISEREAQVRATAAQAEEALNSKTVWTVQARKLARRAMELRAEDPDGSKKVAWVEEAPEIRAERIREEVAAKQAAA